MFNDGQNLVWLASENYTEENFNSSLVTFTARTGANTALVRMGNTEFEVFLDELDFPEAP